MANVLFSRTDSPSTKPITDGQIIFDTSGNGKMYLDNGTTRLEMGGAINVDATLDATSTNPIQNKGVAGVMLSELEEVRGVTKKGFLTDALATKTLDAKIGTTDISSIGDGTVTGAISDVNGKLQLNEVEYSSFISASSVNSIDKAKIYKSNNRLCGYIQINTDNAIRSDGRIILGQTLFVKTGYRPKQVCLLAGQVYSNTYSKYCPAIYQLDTDGGLVVTTPLNDGSVTGFYINLDYDLA